MTTRSHLVDALDASSFAVCVELQSPRSPDTSSLLAHAAQFAAAGAQFATVTDGALGRPSVHPVVAAHLIERHANIQVTAHLAARRRSKVALAGDLLGASAAGIGSILAVTGDPDPSGQGRDSGLESLDLLALAQHLSTDGLDIACGVACDPDAPDLQRELERLRRKLALGARFVVCQPRFGREGVEAVSELLHTVIDVPLLVGIVPLEDADHARRLQRVAPTVAISDRVISDLIADPGSGAHIAADTVAAARELAQGAVIMQAGARDLSLMLEVLRLDRCSAP